jgi:hypothetical protein
MEGSNEQQFIETHFESDLNRLLLNKSAYPEVDVPYLVSQISALRKIKSKVPSWFNTRLRFPPTLSLEQASSEETALYKSRILDLGTVLDGTGGMGIDSFFLSAKAKELDYLEQDAELVELARLNFGLLGRTNVSFNQGTLGEFLNHSKKQYDLIYLDPARRGAGGRRVFRLEDCSPNIPELRSLLFEHAPRVLVKTAPVLDIKAAAAELAPVVAVWVVGVQNEVKEVLYLMDKNGLKSIDAIPVHAVDLGKKDSNLTFTFEQERATEPMYGSVSNYLYEPFASVLKAGAFQYFASYFGLTKLHKHTHLYTSETLVDEVCARVFEVIAICSFDKKAVREFVPEGNANVAVRNFPVPAEAVRKKLGLKDGGAFYLFAFTDFENNKRVAITRKVQSD